MCVRGRLSGSAAARAGRQASCLCLERGTRMGLARCVSSMATQVFAGPARGCWCWAGASVGAAQVIANGRGQGRAVVGGQVLMGAVQCSWQRSLVVARRRQSAPARMAVRRRSCRRLCVAPNVLVLSTNWACHDSASSAVHPAGSIQVPVHACPTPPPALCDGLLRTRAHTARHTQCSLSAGPLPGTLAACARRCEGKGREGERAGGHLQNS